MATYIIAALIFGACAFLIGKSILNKANGKSSSCGGSCGCSCASCHPVLEEENKKES